MVGTVDLNLSASSIRTKGPIISALLECVYVIYLTVSLLAVEPIYVFPPENFAYTVNETDPVTFVCMVIGIPAPSIRFYQNGEIVDESTDVHFTLTDNSEPQDFLTSGGTVFIVSRNLTLDNTNDTDSGTYTCAASNVAANVTRDFELIVQGELLFINHPSVKSVAICRALSPHSSFCHEYNQCG